MYEKLIDVPFLDGDEGDWIPADARAGPLFTIAMSLCKRKYLPSKQGRSKVLRDRYSSFAAGRTQDNISMISILDGVKKDGTRLRRRDFKRKRLPRLTRQATEMHMVKPWIKNGIKAGVLKVQAEEVALETFRTQLSRYKAINGSWCYSGYPDIPTNDRVSRELNARDPNNGVANIPNPYRSEVEPQSSQEELNYSTSNSELPTIINMNYCLLRSGDDRATSRNLSEADSKIFNQIRAVFRAARKDRLFHILCCALEDSPGSKLNTVAAAIRDDVKKGNIKVDGVMADALEYSYAMLFGIRSSSEHQNRRERIQIYVRMLKQA